MRILVCSLIIFSIIIAFLPHVYAENVPSWVKNTAGWWASDAISENEFVNAIEFLVKDGIIHIERLNHEQLNSCQFTHIPILNNLTTEEKIKVCKTFQIDYLDERLDCDPCDYDIKYNSYGFRGPEISKIKPDNTYRIFLVGGSNIANTEYFDESFTTNGQMLEKIQRLDLDVNVEINNAAVVSAKSWHELQISKEILYDFEPDMIIHYTGWNDMISQIKDYSK